MKEMIADYMEKGFLENIEDMFKHDRTLYSLIGDLMNDERSRVRIGTVALVESLKVHHYKEVLSAIPGIASVLKSANPTVRGDAAYLLGVIGHKDAVPFLSALSNDRNKLVRDIAAEAIEQISSGALPGEES